MKNQKYILFLILSLTLTGLYAQKPTEVPNPSDKPIDLTNPSDVIIFIVLPLIAVLLYFIWRGKQKKRKH